MSNADRQLSMKDLFPGHFKHKDEEIKKVWETCVFVLDANILLNLYRYSDATRKEFIQLLEKIQDRIWIPHRAAEEYLNNRLRIICEQEKNYESTINDVGKLKDKLNNSRQHPFISDELMKKVDSTVSMLIEELSNNRDMHTRRISNDEIKDEIFRIFYNKVGLPFDRDELQKLMDEGEERYRQKIPPGFKDSSKASDSDVFAEKCRKYGDFILWRQVLEYSRQTGAVVVLVTDDKKEDWWEKSNGKTVGPLPALVKEFREVTKQAFYMYHADGFLQLAEKYLDTQVSPEIVKEVREVMRRDKINVEKGRVLKSLFQHERAINRVKRDWQIARRRIKQCQDEINSLQEQMLVVDAEITRMAAYKHEMTEAVHDTEMARAIYDDSELIKRRESLAKRAESVRKEMEAQEGMCQFLEDFQGRLEQKYRKGREK